MNLYALAGGLLMLTVAVLAWDLSVSVVMVIFGALFVLAGVTGEGA